MNTHENKKKMLTVKNGGGATDFQKSKALRSQQIDSVCFHSFNENVLNAKRLKKIVKWQKEKIFLKFLLV